MFASRQTKAGLAEIFSLSTRLRRVHQKFMRNLETLGGHIQMIAYCPHLPADQCHCRKPNTGLLRAINDEFRLDADTTWMVGDTAKDIECAVRMGIGLLVKTGKGQDELEEALFHVKQPPFLRT